MARSTTDALATCLYYCGVIVYCYAFVRRFLQGSQWWNISLDDTAQPRFALSICKNIKRLEPPLSAKSNAAIKADHLIPPIQVQNTQASILLPSVPECNVCASNPPD